MQIIILSIVFVVVLNVTLGQDATEKSRCTQFKRRVFEYNTTFLPLSADDVDEIVIKGDKCKRKYSPFVVGGVKAEPKEFPESARLGRQNNGNTIWFCGGTLISVRFILTAAHCLYSEHGEVNHIRIGDLDFNSTTDLAQPEDFGVQRTIPHPDYDWRKETTYHDIGLVELNRDVRLNDFKVPACLPLQNGDEQTQYLAIGWGAVRFLGPESGWLQKVGLNRFNYSRCASFVNEAGIFERGLDDESQICAGSDLERDTCNGDSGGPLLKYHPDYPCMHMVVGVTSAGIGNCGTPGVPAVYTRVRYYINWINNIVFK